MIYMISPAFMKVLLALVAVAACDATVKNWKAGLNDHPVIGDAIQYLDGEDWTVTNGAVTVEAFVPGDLLTDLQRGGIIGDPLYELNFINNGKPPVWDTSNWVYTTMFDVQSDISLASPSLVFDGVKMAANAYLNGVYLGSFIDQFLRYNWPVASILKATGNNLTIEFTTSADVQNAEGRWMSCTGGWDWAPYSNTATADGATTFSKGIWKSVYIVSVSTSSITHIVPHTYYNGSYPTSPMADGTNGPWTVSVRTYFNSPAATTGSLTVNGTWAAGASVTVPISLPAGAYAYNVTIPASNVQLWWPNGVGAQNLYTVTVQFTPSSASHPAIGDTRRIGFRVFTLVTADDSNPSSLNGLDGSGNLTMRFKVNGANIWSRGGNMIPTEELEGRMSAEVLQSLVQSAADSNFNTFRVWGGGIFYPDAFYDAADEAGILMYHDLMYAQESHSPLNSSTQDAEIRHQIRRLSHHPSIAIWDGCNECGGHGIYASFAMTVVVEEDSSRSPWPSCPSNGWISGVDTLWSLPNGKSTGLLPKTTGPSTERASVVFSQSAAGATIPCAGDLNCSVLYNTDLDVGTTGANPPAASPQECCDICANTTGCWAAVFYTGTCWLKAPGSSTSWNDGRVAVWPPGHGPVPPAPTPAPRTIETHGPYQHGGGFPAVNGGGGTNPSPFNANIPPSLGPSVELGPQFPGVYASEFGCSVFSSFESMAPTLDPEHWGMHGGAPNDNCTSGFQSTCTGGNAMAQRNYPCDNIILTYFGALDWNATGVDAFQKQLYLCLLGQALEMKSDIEARRSQNEFGTVTWQLNEIWPTGGWGSVEYGTVDFTSGQVVGGRWKPLQYFMKARLYKDVAFICGNDGRCIAKNDNPLKGFTGTASVEAVHLVSGAASQLASIPLSLGAGAGASQWTCLNGGNGSACTAPATVLEAAGCASTNDCIVYAIVTDANDNVVTDNVILVNIPGSLNLPAVQVKAVVGTPLANGQVPILVSSTGTALYVHLTTLAQGIFSDNSFVMFGAASQTILFNPAGAFDIDTLTSTLRVEHLQQYV